MVGGNKLVPARFENSVMTKKCWELELVVVQILQHLIPSHVLMYNTLQPLPSLLLPLSSPRRSLPHLTTITTTTTSIASNSHQPHSHNSKHDQPRQRPLQPSNVATRRVGRDDRGGCYCFSTVSLGLSTASSYLVGKMVTTTVGNETREEKGKEERGKGNRLVTAGVAVVVVEDGKTVVAEVMVETEPVSVLVVVV